MSISTSNTSQLITTSNTTTTSLIDSPALYLGANNNQDYDIDSGVVYQNSGILLGNSGSDVNGTVNLYIHGVYNGIAQWSGNTITVNYAGAGNNTLTYTAGATGTQTDYPTNYDDDIIIYQS
jgi:hypothetical protein